MLLLMLLLLAQLENPSQRLGRAGHCWSVGKSLWGRGGDTIPMGPGDNSLGCGKARDNRGHSQRQKLVLTLLPDIRGQDVAWRGKLCAENAASLGRSIPKQPVF